MKKNKLLNEIKDHSEKYFNDIEIGALQLKSTWNDLAQSPTESLVDRSENRHPKNRRALQLCEGRAIQVVGSCFRQGWRSSGAFGNWVVNRWERGRSSPI